MCGLYDGTKNPDTKICFCHDGADFPLLAARQNNGRWVLYGISDVHGMGNAEYKKKIIDDDFDEVVPLNSFTGRSYLALLRRNKWGLLEIKDNGTLECEWKIVSNFIFDNLDKLLHEMKIDRNVFMN